MATHSSILAWKIPQPEEPGRLQFMGSQRVGRDQVTTHSTALTRFTFNTYLLNCVLIVFCCCCCCLFVFRDHSVFEAGAET